MELNSNSWHVKWFKWSCRALDNAWPSGGFREHRFTWRTDLCTYFRIIMMGTLAALYSGLAWFSMVAVFSILPIYLFGIIHMMIFYAVLAGVAVIGLGFIWLALEGFPSASQIVKDRVSHMVMVTKDGSPTVMALVAERIRAAKNRYCPTISFKREDRDNAQ